MSAKKDLWDDSDDSDIAVTPAKRVRSPNRQLANSNEHNKSKPSATTPSRMPRTVRTRPVTPLPPRRDAFTSLGPRSLREIDLSATQELEILMPSSESPWSFQDVVDSNASSSHRGEDPPPPFQSQSLDRGLHYDPMYLNRNVRVAYPSKTIQPGPRIFEDPTLDDLIDQDQELKSLPNRRRTKLST